MASSEGDIAGFLRDLVLGPASERRTKPHVGIDECLNGCEIVELTRALLRRDLVGSVDPLWYETRERDGVVICSCPGGVAKDSQLRGPDSPIRDIGVPVKHRSWSDFRVVQMLVVYFITHNNLILLSENIRNNRDGLRRILKEVVSPALTRRSDPLCLTALFKKGKTNIADYCLRVADFVEKAHQDPGYVEILL
jgi:hypothetical protein